ncbi:hypothetical protein BDZ89DRAFT_544865 [Hymenopellis radicata]|nr:hypothetical protein BDZ89DRAFT_544865 [Hymenopellis radicata]
MYQPQPSYDYDYFQQRTPDYIVPPPTPAPDIFSPQTDPRSYHSQSPRTSYSIPPAQSAAYNGRNIYEPISSPSVATTPTWTSSHSPYRTSSSSMSESSYNSSHTLIPSRYHASEGRVAPGSPFYGTPPTPPWMYSPRVAMYPWPAVVIVMVYPVSVDVFHANYNGQSRYRAIGN